MLAAAVIIVLGTIYNLLSPYFDQNAYALDPKSAALLPDSSSTMANLVSNNQGTFTFDPSSLESSSANVLGQATYSSAALSQDPSKGMTVTDPTNNISFTMTPKFKMKNGQQNADRIVYPLSDGNGWAVYTLQGDGYKEDIILSYAPGDTVSYSYTLGLGDKLAAKIENDGSLGIYGNTLLSGNVTTSSDKDAKLLQKARDNAKKDTLLFTLPAPVVMGRNGPVDGISSKYSLKGDELTVTTTGLKKGSYPLAIDPSIYVVTAQQFMQGNNETNINFDVNNKLIKKGSTTGARINSWTNSTNLNNGVWGAQTAAAGGYAYQVGGTTSGGTSKAVNWAQFNTSTNTIDSPNPGSGTCSGWCTASDYNLPDGRANFSLIAYSGYLYAIGGTSANCTAANGTGANGICKTVYIAKLGSNGEPRLWHPTDTNQANWVYWYKDTDLSTERAYAGAAVYNNMIYLLGGETSSGATTAASIGAITPNGTIASWTSSGNTVPSTNAYDATVQVYNGRLYVIGGSSGVGSVPTNTVWYSKISSNGSINTWQQTTSFTTGRISGGTDTSTIWGGYVYISGGCSAVNASGYCTTVQSDMQVASINADGSLDNWYVIPNVSDARFSHDLIAWRNTLYEIGGCSAQDGTSGACTTMLSTVNYGKTNRDGDVSIVSTSTASGTAPCSGGAPYNCNVPTAVGNTLNAVALVNGYLYIMGGCTNLACTSVSTGITYQAVGSDGTLQMPSTCSGSYNTSYCVSSVSLPAGVAAAGVAVFNNTIYLVGGITTGTSIYSVTANNDGSLGSFTTTSLSTATSSAVTKLAYDYAYARANPSSAGTSPGNLYIIGGCTNAAVSCTAYSSAVLKCNISTSNVPSGCSTTNQLQLGSMPNSCGTGVGAMAGAVYANYVYLIGGASSSCAQMSTTIYAKIDDNNNIVATSGSAWTTSASTLTTSRQRGAGFGYNGYLYVVGGYDSSGGSVLSDIEFAKINTSDGSLGAWSTSTITIGQRWGVSVPVSNSFAYVIGGCTAGAAPSSCSVQSQQIQTFQLYNNDSGAPAGYTTSANTFTSDPNRLGVGATILNGYIYVAGGCTTTTSSTPCTTESQDVSYASLDSYGNVGTWTSTTGTLPAARGWGKLEAAGGSLYYIGGQDTSGTAQSTVYYATPSSGNVSSWSTATNGLPNARSDFGATVWNNRLYVVGGAGTSADCTGGVCATVYVSPPQTSGGDLTGSWSTSSTPFNVARRGAIAVAYANNLYVLGGTDGSNFLSDAQYAQISSSSGLASSWSYAESMPQPVADGDGFAANGYIYVVGGKSMANTCSSTTLVAPISANTTIASGNNPTGLGGWFQTNQKYSGPRYGNAALYASGKNYVLGGMNCTAASTYTTAGTYNYVVPAGVTSITVKAWGGGGGGGGGGWGGSDSGAGGIGGGGGYATSTITTTPGETLSLAVGGGGGRGGSSGSCCGQGAGGGGGGYSSVYRSSTPLLIAAGGGGAGGGNKTSLGADGGGGGGMTGSDGGSTSSNGGGGGGTNTSGGAGGTGGHTGADGTALTGGMGGRQASNASGAGAGGSNGGGAGGGYYNFAGTTVSGGGGGGGGYYGGGGGGTGTSSIGSAGGGGGSSYLTGTSQVTETGSSGDPGNSSDTDRGTAGNGGAGGGTNAGGVAGNTGLLVVYATNAITPVVQQTTLLTQPQIAQYSILMDTDTDVYPTNWLMNGVDNSIGAHWVLSYKSMTNPGATGPNGTGKNCSTSAMSNWGLTSTVSSVALGTPTAYTPLDSSGTNTNCARYFFMNVTISAQNTFGYPDDVSRGPTITDLTLNFTADPSKRLLHGRTFIDGLQMPNDTPYASQ